MGKAGEQQGTNCSHPMDMRFAPPVTRLPRFKLLFYYRLIIKIMDFKKVSVASIQFRLITNQQFY